MNGLVTSESNERSGFLKGLRSWEKIPIFEAENVRCEVVERCSRDMKLNIIYLRL